MAFTISTVISLLQSPNLTCNAFVPRIFLLCVNVGFINIAPMAPSGLRCCFFPTAPASAMTRSLGVGVTAVQAITIRIRQAHISVYEPTKLAFENTFGEHGQTVRNSLLLQEKKNLNNFSCFPRSSRKRKG